MQIIWGQVVNITLVFICQICITHIYHSMPVKCINYMKKKKVCIYWSLDFNFLATKIFIISLLILLQIFFLTKELLAFTFVGQQWFSTSLLQYLLPSQFTLAVSHWLYTSWQLMLNILQTHEAATSPLPMMPNNNADVNMNVKEMDGV